MWVEFGKMRDASESLEGGHGREENAHLRGGRRYSWDFRRTPNVK